MSYKIGPGFESWKPSFISCYDFRDVDEHSFQTYKIIMMLIIIKIIISRDRHLGGSVS